MSLLMLADVTPKEFNEWADENGVAAQIAAWAIDIHSTLLVVRVPDEREIEVRLVWADNNVTEYPAAAL